MTCVNLIRISSRDTGKTMVDASLGEIMTTCEKITWLLSEGEKWLKPEYRYLICLFASISFFHLHAGKEIKLKLLFSLNYQL